MLRGLSINEVKLLSVISRLVAVNKRPTTDKIVQLMEIKIPDILDSWEQATKLLHDKGIVLCTTDEDNKKVYNLTEYGKGLAEEIENKNYLTIFFYNEFYKRAERSKAHSEFCRRAYGHDLCQHGMLDMDQLNKLIEVSKLDSNSHVLELGCGNGLITEYIYDQTKCYITGIDIAADAIEQANIRTSGKRSRINLDVKSMENLDYPNNSFDAVISIDSLYFVKDLENTIQNIKRVLKPEGFAYIFFIVPPNVGNIPDTHPAKCSLLAEVLDKLGLKFRIIDFSKENSKHWKLKKQVLQELKIRFEEEGNMFLYNNRMAECKGNLDEFYRFLYIIENVN